MDTQEEMSLEQLPESVLHDVIRISGWLVENGRNQGWQCCVVFPCSSLLSQCSPTGHHLRLRAEAGC